MKIEKLDSIFMAEALKQARKARKKGDVPVGAVIVRKGVVIARGYNSKEARTDPTAHAEMIALKRASGVLNNWRLNNTTLYVTLEPCLMCMGAIIQARVPRLVFASSDPKAGACGSVYDVSQDKRLNHRIKVASGVCGAEAGELLKEFFSMLRIKKQR